MTPHRHPLTDPGPRSPRIHDPQQATALVTETFLPHRLDLSGSSEPLEMQLDGARFGSLTAGRLTYGRAVHMVTAETTNVHVDLPLRGHATVGSGTGETATIRPGQGAVFTPGSAAELAWRSNCVMLCLMTPLESLEDELETLLGRSLTAPLRFDFQLNLTGPAGRRWQDVLDLVLRELASPFVSPLPVASRHLEGLVLDGLLLAQHHSHRDALLARTRPGARTAVQQAVDLLHGDPAGAWSTVRLAQEVHLSVRALQEGFRRDLGVAPMAYLRRLRLRRSRAELEDPSPTTTVGDVAVRHGFAHLGRFADYYRAEHGELPSTTLERAARQRGALP